MITQASHTGVKSTTDSPNPPRQTTSKTITSSPSTSETSASGGFYDRGEPAVVTDEPVKFEK